MHDVEGFLEDAQRFVERSRDRWSLDGDVDMETFNHLARVWVQLGTAADHADELRRLAALQHEDGGWGDRRDDPRSRGRTSAFSCQMLLRVRRALADPAIDAAVERGLDFLTDRQQGDGSWTDDRWHVLDATSVSVGTLIFAVREPGVPAGTLATRQASLDRGMRFVLDQRRDDGLWSHKPTSSPVEITAHLLQKCVLHGVPAEVVEQGCRGLLDLQEPDGDWDRANTDSTCDVVRCLMLASEHEDGAGLRDEIDEACDRAMGWLLDVAQDGAVGVRPGRPPSVLYTCDVIDTALKYRAHHQERQALAGFYR
jgi:squalene cyclase